MQEKHERVAERDVCVAEVAADVAVRGIVRLGDELVEGLKIRRGEDLGVGRPAEGVADLGRTVGLGTREVGRRIGGIIAGRVAPVVGSLGFGRFSAKGAPSLRVCAPPGS